MKIIMSIILSVILLTAVNIFNNQSIWVPSNVISIEITKSSVTPSYRIKDRWRELLAVR